MGSQTIQPLLQMQQIDKRFAGVKALQQAGLNVYPGRIMALIGENGAGKSTLMKVLSGIYPADAGKILLNGKPVAFAGPRAAQQAGISIIHQELNLIHVLSVAENIFLGRFFTRAGRIDRRKMMHEANQLLKRLNVSFRAEDRVADLSVGQRQMVEIAKALSFEAQIIIMDEPTDALTEQETVTLFRVMQDLKAQGKGLVFISHRLREIFQICDDITVLRDGCFIGEFPTKTIDENGLIEQMVGRALTGQYPPRCPPQTEIVLQAENLCGAGITAATFHLHRGEILGVCGLMGSGRSELAKLLYGALPLSRGTITLNDKPLRLRSARDGLQAGIAYVSEDRKEDGLILGMSVAENMTLSALPQFSRYGYISSRQCRQAVQHFIDMFRIKTPSPGQPVGLLSGGNQQKVAISKALMSRPAVLILDEPTRGVDVGARKEIYDLISQLKQEGTAMLLLSSDMPEILGLADRILCLSQGRISAEFSRQEATQEILLAAAMPVANSTEKYNHDA